MSVATSNMDRIILVGIEVVFGCTVSWQGRGTLFWLEAATEVVVSMFNI